MSDESTAVIYHLFADTGVETEVLSAYGRVIRVGLAPQDTPWTDEIVAADLSEGCPLEPGADLAVLHPPCQRFSRATNVSGNPEDHPDLIDTAREIGKRVADHYILENVPEAPLHDPVELEGRMFGVPLNYARAFETSFHVEQPPRQAQLLDNHLYDGSWTGSMGFWRTLKGYSGDYPSREFKRSAIPRPYIEYLLRHWLEATNQAGGSEYIEVPA